MPHGYPYKLGTLVTFHIGHSLHMKWFGFISDSVNFKDKSAIKEKIKMSDDWKYHSAYINSLFHDEKHELLKVDWLYLTFGLDVLRFSSNEKIKARFENAMRKELVYEPGIIPVNLH